MNTNGCTFDFDVIGFRCGYKSFEARINSSENKNSHSANEKNSSAFAVHVCFCDSYVYLVVVFEIVIPYGNELVAKSERGDWISARPKNGENFDHVKPRCQFETQSIPIFIDHVTFFLIAESGHTSSSKGFQRHWITTTQTVRRQ